MQNQNTYSKALEGIKTTKEASDLIEEIKQLQSTRFLLGEKKDMKIKTFNALKSGIDPDELVKSLKNAPTIRLEVAFEPRISTIEAISKWVKTNIRQDALIQVDVNPELLLGSTISYSGKYMDFSLRNKIEQSHDLSI